MGGVVVVDGADAAERVAAGMLGNILVTKQSGAEGREVNQVLVEEGMDIAKEYYLALLLDRAIQAPVFIASAEGGTEIEEVAATRPEAILKVPVDPRVGYSPWIGRKIAFGLGMGKQQASAAGKLIAGLYKTFMATDASLAEINPLIETGDGRVLALDAKMNFDDNALYRHRRSRRIARPERGRSAGGRGLQVRPQLHQAGRQRGLHGQRRRPGHGDDGHHQAPRRQPGELPRRRRRSRPRRWSPTPSASCWPTPASRRC